MPEQTNPTILGELTVSELRALEALRKDEDLVLREIGLAEVRKTNLLASIREMEVRAQGILQEAAKRLQIPAGEVWHVTQEGRVIRG